MVKNGLPYLERQRAPRGLSLSRLSRLRLSAVSVRAPGALALSAEECKGLSRAVSEIMCAVLQVCVCCVLLSLRWRVL